VWARSLKLRSADYSTREQMKSRQPGEPADILQVFIDIHLKLFI
jgi:hypothetical protein